LRLLFAGRLEHEQKGVFDLPLIDETLRRRNVDVRWTIIGGGPDGERLRAEWQSDRVSFLGARSNVETIDRAADHDVFVLPTRFEGLPVALMEAMAVGLVPVVSDIPSGVPDLVINGVNGSLAPVGEIAAYASAIERLAHDRARLDAMSAAARLTMARQFDATTCAAAYQSLYRDYPRLRRRADIVPDLPYGSRLDRPWLPNPVVRTIRSTLRRVSGRPR
jgi:glycosyltransferase involved in cell wall biosynthesis